MKLCKQKCYVYDHTAAFLHYLLQVTATLACYSATKIVPQLGYKLQKYIHVLTLSAW